jgi:hypothetical protein
MIYNYQLPATSYKLSPFTMPHSPKLELIGMTYDL